jgi:GLPGLI family protein
MHFQIHQIHLTFINLKLGVLTLVRSNFDQNLQMKKILLAVPGFFILTITEAQQKQGKVVYELTTQVNMQIHSGDDEVSLDVENENGQNMLRRFRTDKFELTFGNNQSLWIQADETIDDNPDGGEFGFMMFGPDQSQIVFHDFNVAKRIEQREIFDKKFIITDSIEKLSWKLGSETEMILGFLCHKATAQRIGKRMQIMMQNEKIERKEVSDTIGYVAWYTTDIPVPAGPEVQGQLPGLMLSLNIDSGRMVYQAIEISINVDLASIKAPTKGKRVTRDEFKVEQNKMMEQIEKNNQGGGHRMLIRFKSH